MRKNITALILLLVTVFLAGSSQGQDIDRGKAAKIKASCVYQLARLAKWPEGSFKTEKSPLVIGVLGKDRYGFAKYFRSQAKFFKLKERVFDVKSLRWSEGTDGEISPELKKDLEACHILYVTAYEKAHYAEILDGLENTAVLTVGETEDFVREGGMVSFTFEEAVMVIRVDLEALKKATLEVGAEFLQHARTVKKKTIQAGDTVE